MFPYAPWPFTGEVYEIKSSDPSQVAEGEQEVLTYYIPRLLVHSPSIAWHPGATLLAPSNLRIPQFPYLIFHLSVPVPGVISYDPQPDYEEAARLGITAAILTFIILTIKEAPPGRLPEPIPQPN